MAGKIDRLDVAVKFVPDEDENAGIAKAMARHDDEVRGKFQLQIPIKPACRNRQVDWFKRFGYIC